MSRSLEPLEGSFAVCRISKKAKVDAAKLFNHVFSLSNEILSFHVSSHEFSIVMRAKDVQRFAEASGLTMGQDLEVEATWNALRIKGPIAFDETGVLKNVLEPLAFAKIGIFALSTYETDIIMVKEAKFQEAIEALRAEGYSIYKD